MCAATMPCLHPRGAGRGEATRLHQPTRCCCGVAGCARAQSGKTSRIGFLGTSSLSQEIHLVDAFRKKLRELGHVEGSTFAIEFRWAEGRDSRLAALAAELVRLK